MRLARRVLPLQLEALASLHKYFGDEALEVLKRARSETEG
jgi:hypothetical protein